MITDIDFVQLEKLQQQGADLIDVREDDEVAEGMIDGARHLALSDLPEVLATIAQNKPTVFYCRSGRRSMKAAQLVENYAKCPIYNLTGGYLAYLEYKQNT